MRIARSSTTLAILAAAALAGCKDSTGAATITCSATDPVCPPAGLAAGYSGAAGAPSITPTNTGTSFSVSATAFALTGATNAGANGYWLQVSNGVLTAWGVLAVATGAYAAEVPLVCGSQDVILSFGTGSSRSYYRITVTLTGCQTRAVRVQLSWDTGPDSDIDLHLLRPGGSMTTANDCYYSNCQGSPLEWGVTGSAGDPVLDVDDTQGWGPENIFITSGPEPGQYRIVVHNYDNSAATTATVKLFFNDVEVRRWTSQTLDGAANRRYWEVAKFDVTTNIITNVNTYSTTPPVLMAVPAPK